MHTWENLWDTRVFLSRKEDIHKKYIEFRKGIAEKYNSVSDYLIHYRFVEQLGKGERLVLEKNSFPYDVENGVEHLVLWDFRDSFFLEHGHPKKEKSGPLTEKETRQLMADYRQFLKDNIPLNLNLECTLRINPPEWQSVPSIPHCHVFLRKKKRA